jgi:hypothetical protein
MKTRRQQKLGVSKMLAQAEKLAHGAENLLTLGSAGSAAADFS